MEPKSGRGRLKPACSLRDARLPSSAIQAFTPCRGELLHPSLLLLGIGVQNYTCDSMGNYSSIGAVATLFDVSCLYDTSIFDSLTLIADDMSSQTLLKTQAIQDYAIGHHFFVGANGTSTPHFVINKDGRGSSIKDWVNAKKLINIPSTDGSQNVDWLELNSTSGELARTIYRLSTAGGQPPSTCTPGNATAALPYAALYWFFE
ncbi:hypothetical protein DL93DRAFT_2163912 [Clavulina sp. PMI_390]|nr:hypothetical protein DL93DRAFT_2163912 [Clavulina sp. PMI_390]